MAEELDDGAVRVRVAIAEVDTTVAKDTPVDRHARRNTTSVYTAARIFPMLPEKLSTDLTSLAAGEDRLALIIEFVVKDDGSLGVSDLYRARVRNQAKLAYGSVGAWLAGQGPMPAPMAAAPGVDAQIRLQDRVAQKLATRRLEHGALELEVLEPRAVMQDGEVVDLRQQQHNRATQLIEDFMIAANGVTARYLQANGFPALRRVVRSPERWDRIRALAAALGEALPGAPDAKALADFRRQAPRTGRVYRPAAGRRGGGPLRARGQRLRPLDRAQPAFPRSGDAATDQGRPGGRPATLRR